MRFCFLLFFSLDRVLDAGTSEAASELSDTSFFNIFSGILSIFTISDFDISGESVDTSTAEAEEEEAAAVAVAANQAQGQGGESGMSLLDQLRQQLQLT